MDHKALIEKAIQAIEPHTPCDVAGKVAAAKEAEHPRDRVLKRLRRAIRE